MSGTKRGQCAGQVGHRNLVLVVVSKNGGSRERASVPVSNLSLIVVGDVR